MRVYCPDCDNKPPEFEIHYLYRVYIRRQRNSSTNRYQPVGWYCKNCHKFFVFDKEEREIKQALTFLI